MPLSVDCGETASVLQAAYLIVPMRQYNVLPEFDLPPGLFAAVSGVETITAGIATWGLSPSDPAADPWDPDAIYAIGDTVRFTPATDTLAKTYESMTTPNQGNPPDADDGNWTCISQPPVEPGADFRSTYSYALKLVNDDDSDIDTTLAVWQASLTHSLFWTVSDPGDQTFLNGVKIRLVYTDGVFFEMFPGLGVATTGTQGRILSAGPYATLQTWHTSGLSTEQTLFLSGWPPLPREFENPAGIGEAFSNTLNASGGTGPYTFRVVGGALPIGLTLNETTGEISGTPEQNSFGSFTVEVTDSTGATATVTCGLTVGCGSGGSSGGGIGNAFY